MDGTITLTHRNVCKDGFTIVDTADSGESLLSLALMVSFDTSNFFQVFLDLPAPWDAVEDAKVALRVSISFQRIIRYHCGNS